MKISLGRSLLFALSLVLSVPGAFPAQEAKAEGSNPKILPSVARLAIQRKDGKSAAGDAFLAVKDGVLVTARHVVKDAAKVTATFPNGEEFDCPGLVDKDERHNVALVKIKAFGRPLLKIDPAELAVGAKVRCPVVKDGDFGVLETSVAEVTIVGGVKLYRLSGEIPDGNNGSPLVNSSGEVVGIHVMVTRDGQDVPMALPSAYALGLEAAMPVQPWEAAPASAAGASNPPSETKPADEVGIGIAAALISVHDLYVSVSSLSGNIFSWTKYSTVDNAVFYNVQSQVDLAMTQLGWLRTDDPLRAKLIQATGQILAKEKAALEYDVNCNVMNNSKPPATAQAEDLAKRAAAAAGSVPDQILLLAQDFGRLAEKSPEFLKSLPVEMRYYLGLAERRSQLYLGAWVSGRQPMQLLGPGRLSKLGFHGGDRIISLAGREFQPTDDIEDFKLWLVENAGREVEGVVDRGGKQKILRVKIPAGIAAEWRLPEGQKTSMYP